MPVLLAPRDRLFNLINQSFTDDEFDELCFSFGIELDDITSEKRIISKEHHTESLEGSEEILYKIEIPANRYDLLSTEGLAIALRNFLGLDSLPSYKLDHCLEDTLKLYVSSSVSSIRPFVFAAVLKDVSLNPDAYDSFIKMQDKLHLTIARNRTLASVGTHDLDKIQGPFTYKACAPEDIQFIPLNQSKSVRGDELMTHYESDMKIRQYLPILQGYDKYPVVVDANDQICSLPPLINSDLSKLSLATKNIFIEVTATDATKGEMFLKTLLGSFSYYCKNRFSIVPVTVIYENDTAGPLGKKEWVLDLSVTPFQLSTDYVNKRIGIQLSDEEILQGLLRMMYSAEIVSPGKLLVGVSPSRADVLHPCDIMEDVAIQFGYTKIKRTIPKTPTIAEPNLLNKLTDALRIELALSGYTESLTLTLCSRYENGPALRQPNANDDAVILSNPMTAEYQVVRTSLFPGLLKTLASNRAMALPLKIFEISDVVLKDPLAETGARNERRLSAILCNTVSAFDVLHGTLDHIMKMLSVQRCFSDPNISSNKPPSSSLSYCLIESTNETFFPGRRADIVLQNGQVIGTLGVLHPEVVEAFEIGNVVTAFEIQLEPFL